MTGVYLANPNSVHVRRWLELLRAAGIAVHGYTVEAVEGTPHGRWSSLLTRGGPLRYALAGLRLRFLGVTDGIVHAHNASGYGLMALLSGRPYVLTVYGTEIYCVTSRGVIYRSLLGRIVRSARRITCTTPAMRDFLVENFDLDSRKIDMFSLGISSREYYFSEAERAEARGALGLDGSIVITSNRRMRPQYRIDLIVDAFARLRARDDRYRLILFEGDSNADYAAAIRRQVEALGLSGEVVILNGFHSSDTVRRHLLASDVVISIPTSDQMSASVLEALACGATVVAADIPAYRELFEKDLACCARVDSPESLAASISAAVETWSPRGSVREHVASWLDATHSDRAVLTEIRELYDVVGGK
jgi:glycosyltransferase involved in cell wall biosynthesis